jgi:replicative DNA helicase
MNFLDKLEKNIEFKRKNNNKNVKNFWALAVLGVAIGGTILALFSKNYFREIKNIVINNLDDSTNDINEDVYENDENIEEDNNIIEKEIMDTLEHVDEKSLGDVGIAMENAIENLEDVNQSENKIEN